MRREIGSFIEGTETQRNTDGSFFKIVRHEIEKKKIHFLGSGREAISAAICDIEKKDSKINKMCLLPQYTCGSVITPFTKRGWKIKFYTVDRELNINLEDIKRMIEGVRPSVILIHPYYGMLINQQIIQFLQECRELRKIVIIEDLTQALYFIKTPQWSDYRVASLRKWFAIPDGGMISTNDIIKIDKGEEKTEYIYLKRKAQELKEKYLREEDNIKKESFLQLNSQAEAILDSNIDASKMSEFSLKEIEEVDAEFIFKRRQANSDYLDRELKAFHKMLHTFARAKHSPLYYPILVENRKRFQSFLCQNNIFTSVIWQKSRELDLICDIDVQYIYNNVLAIPCDQRYSFDDMERIIYFIKKYERWN